jgi:hypothetical protein
MMVTTTQLANVLQFSVVAAFGAIVVFKMIPAMLLDSFRQNMFAVRDELFDFAAEGNIAFDHPAYVLLRRQMNGFIRYAHQLTVFRILMTAAIHKVVASPEPKDWRKEWAQALESTSTEYVKMKLFEFHKRAMILAFKRLIIGSPLLWVGMVVAGVQLSFEGATRSASQLVRLAAKKALRGPINDRSIEEISQGVAA